MQFLSFSLFASNRYDSIAAFMFYGGDIGDGLVRRAIFKRLSEMIGFLEAS